MLDAFEVITTSGVVLWSRSSSANAANAVNNLINDVFIAGPFRPSRDAASNTPYKHDKYTLKYALVQDLGLIFVVGLVFSLRLQSITDSRRPYTNLFYI